MPVTIKFTRSDGKQFAFDDAPMGVTALDGVGGPKLELYTEKAAKGDGDIITGRRVSSRVITIKASNRMLRLNPQMRKLVSAFFNPLYKYSVEITYGESTRWAHECELKAIAIPTENVYKRFEVTLTMLSPTGYLDGDSVYGKDINNIIPRLGWPWVSVAGVGMLYSVFEFTKAVTIDNDGDAPTYIRAVFTATGEDPVPNPKLIKGEYFVRVLTTMQPGDKVEIDTEKRLVKINGVNALHLVDRQSNWTGMRMERGQNSFGFDADDHENQLSVRIYYSKRFYGMG